MLILQNCTNIDSVWIHKKPKTEAYNKHSMTVEQQHGPQSEPVAMRVLDAPYSKI